MKQQMVNTTVFGKEETLRLKVERRNENPRSDFVVIVDSVKFSASNVKKIYSFLKEENRKTRQSIRMDHKPKLNCFLEWSRAVRSGETTWEARFSKERRSIFDERTTSQANNMAFKILEKVEGIKSLKNTEVNDLFKLIGLFSYWKGFTYLLSEEIDFYDDNGIVDSTKEEEE